MCWPEALTLSTSENTYTTEVARVVREIFAAQDGTQGTSCSNRDTRPKPSCPALVALTVSLAPWGAGWRPIGRLCALHCASPAEETRQGPGSAEQRRAEPTAARRSREKGRIHPSRPTMAGSPFSKASEVDAWRRWHRRRRAAGIVGKSMSSTLGAVAIPTR
jgi:hypothetical protein